MTIKELKKGEYFTLKAIENPTESQVWVRGEYDRETRKYECYKWADVNHTHEYAGTKEIYIDFTF